MKQLGLFLCLMIFSLLSFSQEAVEKEVPAIEFDQTSHDFGTINKNDPAETTFVFTNVSEAPVKLRNVKASCGCTTPNWTKEAVDPSANGEIKVKYNTSRVGPFTKSVTVYYDSADKPVVLYIRGKVEEAEKGSSISYSEVIGGLAFNKLSQHVGTVNSDSTAEVEFMLKNVSPQPIEISLSPETSQAISLEMEKTVIAPGAKASIKAKVAGEAIDNEGMFQLPIKLNTNEEEFASKELQVTGTLHKVEVDKASGLAPNIKFDEMNYNAGVVLAGEKVTHAFTFKNEGEGELTIESVKASCGCTATAPKDKVIKPGATSEILATFDSRGRNGLQNKSITVKTNDPDEPTIVLRLQVEVNKDPFHSGDLGPVASPGNTKSMFD